MTRPRQSTICGIIALTLLALRSDVGRTEVVRIETDSREPFAEGRSFGRSGPYEKLTGCLHFEVSPDDSANERIVDLKLAPHNDRGKVEFWADFCLLKPVDLRRGNRRMLFGVSNRGNKTLLKVFNNCGECENNPITPAQAGDGFLMRLGYSILWCAWNGDVSPGKHRLVTQLPVAGEDGKSITGKIYTEICVNGKSYSQPFWGANSNIYPTVSLDNKTAVLTMRPRRSEPTMEIPRDKWAFARLENGKVVPDRQRLHLKEGFQPGWLYELVYVGKDPRVTGLGFAAVRDSVSFFRRAEADGQGTPNPLHSAVERAYVYGVSQCGRFLHHFIYEGFNSDEKGRMVFDGAIADVGGGGKGSFNHRFAQTTRHGGQLQDNLFPCDLFPFVCTAQEDPVTGDKGDTFARARARGTSPKMFFTETSSEYWDRAASLLHTDVEGKRDVELDPNVRLYFFAGANHGTFNSSPERGICKHLRNILDRRPPLRALLVALDQWVTTGRLPPPSCYPRIADGTLVDVQTWRKMFPRIPGVQLPESCYTPARLDFGPRWFGEGIIDHAPPKIGKPYRTLVPSVDSDGNEVSGIRLPDVEAPLATYTGWNLRGAKCGAEGMLSKLIGARFPFHEMPEECCADGDPRPAILGRYPTRQVYLTRVAEAVSQLQQQRFLLEEDAAAIRKAAADRRFWEGRE